MFFHKKRAASMAENADTSCSSHPCSSSPLGPLFFRLMQSMMSEKQTIPELDALSMAQFRLLLAVHHRKEGSMKDFSEQLGIAQPSVTKLADGLFRRDFIERVPDPLDRRVVRLRTTETAQRLLRDGGAQREKAFAAVWGKLNGEEQTSVLQILERLCRAAEEVRQEQISP